MLFRWRRQDRRGVRARARVRRPQGEGAGRDDRLPRLLRAGPDRQDTPAGNVLRAGARRRREGDRRGAPRQGARRAASLLRPRAGEEACCRGEHPVLPEAVPHRAPQLRRDRPREDRGLHRTRRLQGDREGALRDDARAGRRGDAQVGPARPRRRRLPDRNEVEVRAAAAQGSEVHGLQRRRGRPWRVHGPLHA